MIQRDQRFEELDRLIAADPEPDVALRGHKQLRACERIQPWPTRRAAYLRASGKFSQLKKEALDNSAQRMTNYSK